MDAEQRYCLNCGTRGAEARLPFLEILRADPAQELLPYAPAPPGWAPGAPAAAAPAWRERLRVDTGLVAGVGVLLLAMLVGVLIGSAGDEPGRAAAVAPAPQVISVAGGGAPAAVAATGATGAEVVEEAAGGQAARSAKADRDKESKAPVRATNSAVKELDKLTGAARQKAVERLGKAIPTGGKPPKKDNKPPAGGGDFEEIG